MKKDISVNTLYYAFICLLILIYMLETSSWPNFNETVLHDVLLALVLLCAFVYVILKKYSIKELFQLFIPNFVGVLCYLSSGNSGLFITMLVITLLPDNSLENVLNIIFKEEILLFVGIVLASITGILSNDLIEVSKGAYSVSTRMFGFRHPNMLAAQAISIVLLYLCIKRNGLQRKNIIFALFLIICIFVWSKGRIGFILGLFAVILISFHKNQFVTKYIYKLLPYVYIMIIIILACCIGVFVCVGENSHIVGLINDSLFNGRIGLAYRSLVSYPITLFGKKIDLSIWNSYQYFALDNGQVMILLEYGLVGFIVYFWVIQKALSNIKQKKEFVFAVVLIVFLIWSMYEGTMYFIGKNFALLFLGSTRAINISKRRGEKR